MGQTFYTENVSPKRKELDHAHLQVCGQSGVRRLVISITRIFGVKLTTDLEPDTQLMSKNTLPIKFPQYFGQKFMA